MCHSSAYNLPWLPITLSLTLRLTQSQNGVTHTDLSPSLPQSMLLLVTLCLGNGVFFNGLISLVLVSPLGPLHMLLCPSPGASP